ncbi:MAG: def [Nitrospirae bacterium]|nr:def [Nitrospirota bacterium]MBS1233056.1 def [Nitrospirota bacterium]
MTVKKIQSARTSAEEMFYNVFMAVLEIRKYPEKILKQKTTPIQTIDGITQQLIDDMIETMHSARGVGLAANQVGISQKLCVLDLSLRENKAPLIVLINPFIVERDGIVEAEEGCLSIPGYLTSVKRAEKVFIKGVNREGKDIAMEAEGLLARALQHELDHLEGLLFIDRMSPIKREFFKRRYKKQLKEAKGK